MKQTYELYFPENCPSKEWTDCVTISKDGIEKWQLWSDVLNDWIEVSIFKMTTSWPSKFEDFNDRMIQRFDELYLEEFPEMIHNFNLGEK